MSLPPLLAVPSLSFAYTSSSTHSTFLRADSACTSSREQTQQKSNELSASLGEGAGEECGRRARWRGRSCCMARPVCWSAPFLRHCVWPREQSPKWWIQPWCSAGCKLNWKLKQDVVCILPNLQHQACAARLSVLAEIRELYPTVWKPVILNPCNVLVSLVCHKLTLSCSCSSLTITWQETPAAFPQWLQIWGWDEAFCVSQNAPLHLYCWLKICVRVQEQISSYHHHKFAS